MTTQEAMQRVESLEFSALANLASDFRTFLDILVEQPEIKQLVMNVECEADRLSIVQRLLQMAGSKPDPAYEHPDDVAMAAYLWILSNGTEVSELAAAIAAVLRCEQSWWSRKMAEHVQSRVGTHASTRIEFSDLVPHGAKG